MDFPLFEPNIKPLQKAGVMRSEFKVSCLRTIATAQPITYWTFRSSFGKLSHLSSIDL